MSGTSRSDREFSALEQLAFRGEWDSDEKVRLWHAVGLDRMWEAGIPTNAEHNRLMLLTCVYSELADGMRLTRNNGRECFLQEYIKRYPSSAEYLTPEQRTYLEALEKGDKDQRRLS
jgi:hypothetical protein